MMTMTCSSNIFDETTLVVRNLPLEFSLDEKISLLRYLGAGEVKPVQYLNGDPNKTRHSSIIAKYGCKEDARNVLLNLHQKEILGRRVSVEYARQNDLNCTTHSDDFRATDSRASVSEKFLSKLNSWTNLVNVSLPPPIHIQYKYPPANDQVLKNICKALISTPKFYYQVLHLMNRLNLPCPFSNEFRIDTDILEDEALRKVFDSDDESELDSDQDEVEKKEVPKKKRKRDASHLRVFRFKPPKLPKPTTSDRATVAMRPDEVFEGLSTLDKPSKKIELKISSDLTSSNTLPISNPTVIGQSEKAEPTPQESALVSSSDAEQSNRFISLDELRSNQIPPKDFHILPVFKNYSPGVPSRRLYIKNLNKSVTVPDLKFIYGRYIDDQSEELDATFHIRLMQEGKMKGQAFVTLPTENIAQEALDETNGYILRGKPMVVQFARSVKD